MKNVVLQHNLDEKDLRCHNNANSYLFPHPREYPMSHQCEHSQIFSLFHLHVTKYNGDDYDDHDIMLANHKQRNIPISYYHLEIMCTVNEWILMRARLLYFLSCSYMNFPRISREFLSISNPNSFLLIAMEDKTSVKILMSTFFYSLHLQKAFIDAFQPENFETLLQM